eukprot:CAMPEP_0169267708 /NCGR_PEP_ID=MMETSP1016-20121227/47301_1 /TAXON_ID=342587 /ORGANISM="Karlodinium micrum, Strain CCMP2283" /LENGTH=70 /DNA_ID=CAMNT_0009352151 /DNA_START=184 /DNA_END=396 /DNA_ORIENTATION=+
MEPAESQYVGSEFDANQKNQIIKAVKKSPPQNSQMDQQPSQMQQERRLRILKQCRATKMTTALIQHMNTR